MSLWDLYQRLELPGAAGRPARVPFRLQVETMLYSHNAWERSHVPLGFSWHTGLPVFAPASQLNEHGLFSGPTGCGKTALAITRLALWAIEASSSEQREWLRRHRYESDWYSLVVVDLKGSNTNLGLFHTLWRAAGRAGYCRKRFTTVHGWASHLFDRFAPCHVGHLTDSQAVQQTFMTVGLVHAIEQYGRGHFTEAALEPGSEVYRRHHPRTLRRFAWLMRNRNVFRELGLSQRDYEDAKHAIRVLTRLATVSVLNPPDDAGPDDPVVRAQIELPRLWREPTLLAAHAPTSREPANVQNAIRLLLDTLLDCASDRSPEDRGRVIVIIDEFADLGDTNVASFLRKARSLGVSVFLAVQSLGQLKANRNANLFDAAKSCTGVKQVFSHGHDPETIDWLQKLSGEGRYALAGWDRSPGLLTPAVDLNADGAFDPDPNVALMRMREEIRPALEPNLINAVSAHPQASFLLFLSDRGANQYHGRVVPIVSDFPVAQKEHERLEREPWPDPEQGTLVVKDLPPITGKPTRGRPTRSNVLQALDEHLRRAAFPDAAAEEDEEDE